MAMRIDRTGDFTPKQRPQITERQATNLANWGRRAGFESVMRTIDRLPQEKRERVLPPEAQDIAITACDDKPGF